MSIDGGGITLKYLSYIWMSFGLLMVITSFMYLDWKFSWLNLPYQFNTKQERTNESECEYLNYIEQLPRIFPDTSDSAKTTKVKWYVQIRQRQGVWKYLTSPLYILVVLFLSLLLMPSIFLTVTWYPWVLYITNQNIPLGKTD